MSRSGLIVSFYGILAATAVAWGALRGQANIFIYSPSSTARVGAHPSYGMGQLVSSLGIGIAIGLLVVLLTRVVQERYAWARMLHNEFRHRLGPLDGQEILLLALASSVGEECFFRGALLSHMQAVLPGFAGTFFAILGSSMVFGLLHIGPGVRFLPWTISSLGVGLLLGSVYVGMGDLLGPIAIHFTVNYLNLQDIVRRQMEA